MKGFACCQHASLSFRWKISALASARKQVSLLTYPILNVLIVLKTVKHAILNNALPARKDMF